MGRLFLIILSLFLLFSCRDNGNDRNQNSQKTAIKKQQLSLHYAINKSVYTVSDTIKVILKNTASFPVDSIVISIQNSISEYKKNADTLAIFTTGANPGNCAVNAKIMTGEEIQYASLQLTLLSDIVPAKKTYKVISSYKHDDGAYTQGLEFYNNNLYEGTGLRGLSSLRKVDLTTGKVLKNHMLQTEYFGEGITILDNKIYQLTWQSNKGFVYDLESFSLLREFNYSTEGWGLTNNEIEIIMSDGSNNIYFLDKESLSEIRRIQVYDNTAPVMKLNELEYIDGYIYANIYTLNYIVKIDPETGKVLERINLTNLLKQSDRTYKTDVLNGIAYNKQTGKLYVTGKNWSKLFEIEIVDSE